MKKLFIKEIVMYHEQIIETKFCKHCNTSFDITDKDREFYEKVSPIFHGKKYHIPTPILCPSCREQRRMNFRNERNLYKRWCDITKKEIISIYSPDKKNMVVYNESYWYGDAWNPLDYGMTVSFNTPLFSQFKFLIQHTPFPSTFNSSSNVNSEFGNHTGDMKNCYLTSASWDCESVYYGTRVASSSYVMDVLGTESSENIYQCIASIKNTLCFYAYNCNSSSSLYGCFDCTGCQDCILSTNLINKSYCIENKQYSKEEYEAIKYIHITPILKNGWEYIQKKTQNTFKKNLIQVNCENSLGDTISNCKNVSYLFDVSDAEDCKYCVISSKGSKDIYDATGFGYNLEKAYEIIDDGANGYINCFCAVCHGDTDIFYCFNCYNSQHLFFCTGLRNKSYCILNKQYTKEEYEQLVPQIIEHMMKTGEWGEFFPSNISPFGYNETVAQEYYPLTREEVLSPVISNDYVLGSFGEEGSEKSLSSHNIQTNTDSSSFHSSEGQPSPVISNESERSMNSHNIQSSTDSSTSLGMTSHSEGQRDPRVKHEDDNHTKTFLQGPIFNWSDYEPPFPKVEKIIKSNQLPESIQDIPDDILNWAIECEVTKKPFRIIKQELEFYRKHNLPIPRRHPDQRHKDRMNLRNPRKLFERNCDKCSKPIQTTYSPERPEKVYCEECYNKEVY